MLFAKISPSAKVATQDGPFTVMGNDAYWITATTQYSLGQQYTRFSITFGNFNQPTPPDQPAGYPFQSMLNIYEDFTASELATWGENDEAALQIIAGRIGTTIVEVLDRPDIDFV
jgi:hypothetical protein